MEALKKTEKSKKSKRPKSEPCGTQHVMSADGDLSMLT